MNDAALILAAHGSRVDASSNPALWQLAETVREQSTFAEVTCAFHHGAPGFADVLGTIRSRCAVVVPIMTSEGYYSRVALPRALTAHPDFARHAVQITRPIGVHPEVPNVMRMRLNELLERFNLSASETSVAVIGHGTPRNANSKIATNDLAAALHRMGPCGDVFPAFLDEEPFVETVPDRAEHATIVALLFLIAAGPHALEDVPRRLGLLNAALSPPYREMVNDRIFFIDEAFGNDPAIIPLIIDLANFAAREVFKGESHADPHASPGFPSFSVRR
ncbi:MAG: hypothetical protein HY287_05940 [Planctomycetes bacterium]|nr:hypothetical protein [Planctomycetota bacterium]MBI3833853.1 hypothetical protein [Planctomycetota bacterium]